MGKVWGKKTKRPKFVTRVTKMEDLGIGYEAGVLVLRTYCGYGFTYWLRD
jgi:hypothetical protein